MMLAALLVVALEPTPTPVVVWTAPPTLSLDAHRLPDPVVREDGTTCLAASLATWTLDRLAAYGAYPAQCQARLDAARSVCESRTTVALSDDAALEAGERSRLEADAAARWPSWAVVGSFALGAFAGGATLWAAAQVVR